MKQFYIYIHFKPDGTPFYVGKGHGRRCMDFLNGRNKFHLHIIRKYGSANIEVLKFNRETEDQALHDEVLWIKVLRDSGFKLANISNGGEGPSGIIPSQATREKLSLAHKGRTKTAEHRDKIRKAHLGKKRPPRSKEWQDKISNGSRGRTRSPEERLKGAFALTGKKRPNDVKMKISSKLKGIRPSEETRKKQSISAKELWQRKKVASQLDQLQKLLLGDGVKVQ